MLSNINIFAKIVNIMVLNKWKNRVKEINQEYHKIFIWYNNKLCASAFQCKKCSDNIFLEHTFNYRKFKDKNFKCIKYINTIWYKECEKCDEMICIVSHCRKEPTKIIYPDYREKIDG